MGAKTKYQKVVERRTEENKYYKRKMKKARRNLEGVVAGGGKDAEALKTAYDIYQKSFDKAAKVNVIHKNKAARKKSQAKRHQRDYLQQVGKGSGRALA